MGEKEAVDGQVWLLGTWEALGWEYWAVTKVLGELEAVMSQVQMVKDASGELEAVAGQLLTEL